MVFPQMYRNVSWLNNEKKATNLNDWIRPPHRLHLLSNPPVAGSYLEDGPPGSPLDPQKPMGERKGFKY